MFMAMSDVIWLYPEAVDFRRQIDGLVLLVADHLQLNPVSGQLFLFRDRRAKKIKILFWDRNGFWLLYKRLEKGKFKFPSLTEGVMQLTHDQLSWLLSGLDYWKHCLLPNVNPSNFY